MTFEIPPDPLGAFYGIEAVTVRPGYAEVRLSVRPEHLNIHGTVHGGILFLLADSAFAYAANAGGVQSVGSHCSISYHVPGKMGDILTAIASETYLEGRAGIYDAPITNQHGDILANFRGHSIALRKS